MSDIHEFRIRIKPPFFAIAIYNRNDGVETGSKLTFDCKEDMVTYTKKLLEALETPQCDEWLSI